MEGYRERERVGTGEERKEGSESSYYRRKEGMER